MYKYTTEAKEFMCQIDKFKQDEFEKWIESLVLQIGSQNITQYIDEKERWNCKPILNKEGK